MKSKSNIVIVGGGFSNEREISLNTSRQIAKTLPREKFNISLLEITKERKWLLKNKPLNLTENSSCECHSPNDSRALALNQDYLSETNFLKEKKIDVAFLTLHGKY